MNLNIGDKVYYVPSDLRNSPTYLTVKKVGRKNITFENTELYYDLELKNVQLKKYGYRGNIYSSEEYYKEYVKVSEVWKDIRQHYDLPSQEELQKLLEMMKELKELGGKDESI